MRIFSAKKWQTGKMPYLADPEAAAVLESGQCPEGAILSFSTPVVCCGPQRSCGCSPSWRRRECFFCFNAYSVIRILRKDIASYPVALPRLDLVTQQLHVNLSTTQKLIEFSPQKMVPDLTHDSPRSADGSTALSPVSTLKNTCLDPHATGLLIYSKREPYGPDMILDL